MTALLLAGFGLVSQGPCGTVDQFDEGWALVRLADGSLTHLPFPAAPASSMEGARVCPSGLLLPPTRRRGRPVLVSHSNLEEILR